ncbi:MAG TPA: hypothetical protein VKE40_28280 [Gemmataceae bacterium]|nr:hypothetical protein [Gemmataceae bacterium]
MAKKADLEASFRECLARCGDAARAEVDGDFAAVLERAESTLPLLRAYIAYLRRYQGVEAPRLPSIELILHYAPPMFSRRSLDAVDAWLAQASRTERGAYPDLPVRLTDARRRLALAARVWPSWRAAASDRVSPDAAEVAQLFDFWIGYGAVVKCAAPHPPQYQLVTHPQRKALGKCARCGHKDIADWADLLGARVCPHCRATSDFVIVARAS